MIVYLPILTLSGIEGKMFVPMSQVVLLALCGALILSFTFIPAMVAIFVQDKEESNGAIMQIVKGYFTKVLYFAIKYKKFTLITSVIFCFISIFLSTQLGNEFIPRLDEKDFVVEFFSNSYNFSYSISKDANTDGK